MINKVENIKNQMKAHTAIVKTLSEAHMRLHVLLCEDVLHAAETGDCSLLTDLYMKLGWDDGKVATRNATIKEWLIEMSGGQLRIKAADATSPRRFALAKGWSKDKFKLDIMEETFYWSKAPERAAPSFTVEQFITTIKRYVSKLERAAEEDNFDGDKEKVTSFINNVASFAEAQAKRLTPKELGLVPAEAPKSDDQGQGEERLQA